MHTMEKIKEMLDTELDALAMKGELSAASLDRIHRITDTIKNIDKIEMLEDVGDYSNRTYVDGDYARDYDRGSSYARRRDSMGRYARTGYSERRRYSRAEGKEDMIDQIEDMMHKATTEKERQALERCMDALHNA